MAGKFFFKDRSGNELTDHPYHGIPSNGMGSGIATNGKHMCDDPNGVMWRDNHGRMARTWIQGFTTYTESGRAERPEITIEDFPGHTGVLVKAWFPRTEFNEEFWLIGDYGREKIRNQSEKKRK